MSSSVSGPTLFDTSQTGKTTLEVPPDWNVQIQSRRKKKSSFKALITSLKNYKCLSETIFHTKRRKQLSPWNKLVLRSSSCEGQMMGFHVSDTHSCLPHALCDPIHQLHYPFLRFSNIDLYLPSCKQCPVTNTQGHMPILYSRGCQCRLYFSSCS